MKKNKINKDIRDLLKNECKKRSDNKAIKEFKDLIEFEVDKNYKGKTLRELKEFDTFEILEDIEKIKVPRDIKILPLFKEGVIKFRHKTELMGKKIDAKIFVYINNNVLEAYLYRTDNYTLNFLFEYTHREGKIDVKTFSNDVTKNMFVGFQSAISEAMAYLNWKILDKEVAYKQDTPSKKSSSTSLNSSVTEKKKVKVISGEKIIYEVTSSNKDILKTLRNYTRHTESWSVLGHYRQYKSGKKIWINPHVKGTGKKEITKYIIK